VGAPARVDHSIFVIELYLFLFVEIMNRKSQFLSLQEASIFIFIMKNI